MFVVEHKKKLAKARYSVQLAYTGEDGYCLAQARSFDLINWMLCCQDMIGFEILATLQKYGIKTPVLILTAKDPVADRVRGLDVGVDVHLLNVRVPGVAGPCASLAEERKAGPGGAIQVDGFQGAET